jgi:cytochrome c2
MLRPAAFVVSITLASRAAFADPMSGDPVAGRAIFEHICHACHAALPYTGRVGVANLPAFLANPRRYNPKTAMTFPGLRSRKDIADVISFITAGH